MPEPALSLPTLTLPAVIGAGRRDGEPPMITAPAQAVLQALILAFFGTAQDPAIDRTPYEKELVCLAQTVWFEARGSSFADKLAVAQVVVNRVASREHGDTVCSVVWEPAQFSWTADGLPDQVELEGPIDENAWTDSALAALTAWSAALPDLTRGATHYHADYVSPHWAQQLHARGRFGRHLYYAAFEPAPEIAPPVPAPR